VRSLLAAPEEIAYLQGLTTREQFLAAAPRVARSDYGAYLAAIARE
jgi:hypothetical protein